MSNPPYGRSPLLDALPVRRELAKVPLEEYARAATRHVEQRLGFVKDERKLLTFKPAFLQCVDCLSRNIGITLNREWTTIVVACENCGGRHRSVLQLDGTSAPDTVNR